MLISQSCFLLLDFCYSFLPCCLACFCCSTWTIVSWISLLWCVGRWNRVISRFLYLSCVPRSKFTSQTKSIDSSMNVTLLLCQIWFSESAANEFNFTSHCQVQCGLLTSHKAQCHLLNTELGKTNGWRGKTERRRGEEIERSSSISQRRRERIKDAPRHNLIHANWKVLSIDNWFILIHTQSAPSFFLSSFLTNPRSLSLSFLIWLNQIYLSVRSSHPLIHQLHHITSFNTDFLSAY